MNANTYLLIRDVTEYVLQNKDKYSQEIIENNLIPLMEKQYSPINYHAIYATVENIFTKDLNEEERAVSRVKMLKRIPQFEQRSQEWYNVRKLMITASDIATVTNDNPYQKSIAVLRKKCGLDDKFTGNKYTEWGVKYEEIANKIYEIDYNTKVIEFGLIQHPNISFLGASPDGITVDGIMLEIKCPYVRELKPDYEHNGVPHYYWIQVQIQLEVCELEYCDFQQCKLVEYDSKDEYDEDNFDGYKGCVVCEKIENNKLKYHYAPSLKMSEDELNKWLENYTDEKYFVTWWKLVDILYTRLKRDREWFREKLPVIESFWQDVVYYRRHGVTEILPKPRKKKPPVCLLDSDSDSKSDSDSIPGQNSLQESSVKESSVKESPKTVIKPKYSPIKKSVKKPKKASNSIDLGVCLL